MGQDEYYAEGGPPPSGVTVLCTIRSGALFYEADCNGRHVFLGIHSGTRFTFEEVARVCRAIEGEWRARVRHTPFGLAISLTKDASGVPDGLPTGGGVVGGEMAGAARGGVGGATGGGDTDRD